MNKKKIITFVLMCMTITTCTYAQNGINSPYSRYGFGIQADRSMGFNKGMAGVAQGIRNGQIINTANPASYSAVDSLTALFDMGLTLQNGNYKMGNLQQNVRNTSFDYMAFHFRATRGVGVAMGILPYSNINYSFTSNNEQVEGSENLNSAYAFAGNGGLHQTFLGVGWQIFKPLSIGFNGSYLFGNYSHTTTMSFSDTNIFSIRRGYSANISTWMADFALQYTQPLGKDRRLTFGASYGLGHNINNKAIRYTETFSTSSYETEGVTGDTLSNAFQFPHTFSAGLAYYKGEKFMVAADFELQKWSNCKFPAQDDTNGSYTSTTGQLNDKIRISAGCAYTPNWRSSRLAQRITYKFGGFYGQSYANADNTGILTDKPHEYGISAGLSIPTANRINTPRIHISAQWMHNSIPYVSNISNNITTSTLTENYLRLSIGLTFNESWFYKFKME